MDPVLVKMRYNRPPTFKEDMLENILKESQGRRVSPSQS